MILSFRNPYSNVILFNSWLNNSNIFAGKSQKQLDFNYTFYLCLCMSYLYWQPFNIFCCCFFNSKFSFDGTKWHNAAKLVTSSELHNSWHPFGLNSQQTNSVVGGSVHGLVHAWTVLWISMHGQLSIEAHGQLSMHGQ